MSAQNSAHPTQPPWDLNRVGIIGAGAMGTSLAAIIGQKVPTVLVCRNPRRAAELFEHSAVTTGLIRASSRPIIVSCIADLATIGGVSVLFVATKTTAIPSVAAELKPLLAEVSDHPEGLFIVSYQNGIEPGRQLLALLEYPRVLRMVLNFGATMRDHRAVDITLNAPPHHIGTVDQAFEPICRQVAQVLSDAGLETNYDADIEQHVWAKSVINASMNPVAALVNSPVGQVLDSPARIIVDKLLREGIAVAQAQGRDLGGEAFLKRAYEVLQKAECHTPSMVEDIRSGRESEVGQLNRQILDHGRRLGVPTPTHEVIDALIETFDWKIYAIRY